MQYKVARGAMALIAHQCKNGDLDSMGVTLEDFKKLTSHTPWLAPDRNRMNQVFNSIMSGTMDVVGVPRFQMPAEYIAAGIAMFVAPINIHVACRFMERIPTAESLGRGLDQADMCTAQQLFSLVVQLVADPETSHAKVLFERNTQMRIENSAFHADENSSVESGKRK